MIAVDRPRYASVCVFLLGYVITMAAIFYGLVSAREDQQGRSAGEDAEDWTEDVLEFTFGSGGDSGGDSGGGSGGASALPTGNRKASRGGAECQASWLPPLASAAQPNQKDAAARSGAALPVGAQVRQLRRSLRLSKPSPAG